jgi:excisionase family DNA binding protein
VSSHYVVEIELDRKLKKDSEIDELHEQLGDFHLSIRESPVRNVVLTLTIVAEGLRQATAIGLSLVASYGVPLAVTAQPESIRDQRLGWAPIPDLLTVTEVAERTGTTRQAVLQRIGTGSLPASRVGSGYAIPAAALADAGEPVDDDQEGETTS